MIMQAYEVFSLVGGGYAKRQIHGHAWTREKAQEIADTVMPRRYEIGPIHLIRVEDRWHRIAVLPVPAVLGDLADAQISRIAKGDIPVRATPGMFFVVGDRAAVRLGLNIEKNIDRIASYAGTETCKLYTLRIGGRLPLLFKGEELRNVEARQEEIFNWLHHEIEFRKAQGEADLWSSQ